METALGIALGLLLGAGAAEFVYRWHKWRGRKIAATQLSWSDAWTVIDGWARRERWFVDNGFLNQAAQMEHMRLMRDEPELTLEQNLERVAAVVKQKYPAAFQTLH